MEQALYGRAHSGILYGDRKEAERTRCFDVEGFYLDERETAGCYRLQMLEECYQEDLEFLHQKVCKEWIRVQNHELDEVDKEYTEYYNAVVSMIVQSVSGLLMDVVEESEVRLADTFQIVYGQYMGNATVVYARGKNEDGIFTD